MSSSVVSFLPRCLLTSAKQAGIENPTSFLTSEEAEFERLMSSE